MSWNIALPIGLFGRVMKEEYYPRGNDKFSIVTPLFNEETSLEVIYTQLAAVSAINREMGA